jgi:hypothetical protein
MNTPRSRTWLVERAALGESSAEILTAAEHAEVEAIRRDNEVILATLPPALVAEEVRRRLHVERARESENKGRAWRPFAAIAAPLALGVIAAISFGPGIVHNTVSTEPELTRVKGDRLLSIHLKKEGRSQRLDENEVIRRGDLLQLAYGAGNENYGVVVSIDGAGTATLHLPQTADAESAVLDTRGAELPYSYELDAAPEFERFFLVTSAEPFAAEEVFHAANRLAGDRRHAETAPLALPPNFSQTSVLLRKVSAP